MKEYLYHNGSLSQLFIREDELSGQRILVKTADSLNPSPLAYMKLYNEFEILKDLNLKGVRKVIDLEYKGKTPCLLLEFVEGTTITKYFNEGRFDRINRSSSAKDIDNEHERETTTRYRHKV